MRAMFKPDVSGDGDLPFPIRAHFGEFDNEYAIFETGMRMRMLNVNVARQGN